MTAGVRYSMRELAASSTKEPGMDIRWEDHGGDEKAYVTNSPSSLWGEDRGGGYPRPLRQRLTRSAHG